MGTVINLRQLATQQNMYRLIIYANDTYEQEASAVSINKRLAEELRKLKPTRRTMQLEKCFNKILDSLPEKVVIKDIDVMFNHAYRVDVIRILVEANKGVPAVHGIQGQAEGVPFRSNQSRLRNALEGKELRSNRFDGRASARRNHSGRQQSPDVLRY